MKTIFLTFIFSLLFFPIIIATKEIDQDQDFKIVSNITILNDSNFVKAINKYDYLLVLFFSPLCIHCQKFHPEYIKVANALSSYGVVLSSLDCKAYHNLAEKYKIVRYPSLLFFVRGDFHFYPSEKIATSIVDWVKNIIHPEIKKLDEFKSFKTSREYSIIYFGSNKTEIEMFYSISYKYSKFSFATTNSTKIMKKYLVSDGTIILFNDFFDERHEIKMQGKAKEEIEAFIEELTIPKLLRFDNKGTNILWNKQQPGIIIMLGERSPLIWEYEKKLKKLIKEKIGHKIKVVLTDVVEGIHQKLELLIRVGDDKLPLVKIIDTKKKKRYKMEGEINDTNILNFIDDWKAGLLVEDLKSQKVPETNDGLVYQLVGTTFEHEVFENEKDVVVLFCSGVKMSCRRFKLAFELLARRLKSKENNQNPELRFATIELLFNEITTIRIESVPSVRIYPGNRKDKEPIAYDGDETIEDMIEWVKNNTFHEITYVEPEEEVDNNKNGTKNDTIEDRILKKIKEENKAKEKNKGKNTDL